MNSTWNDFLAKQGAQDNFEHFGDIKDELAASRSATIVAPLADQGLIRATGEEAVGFLHNLLTNDINHIPVDGARHAGMCTAKGRLIASFLVWREGGDYMLQLSADILPAIHKKLSMYVLRSKVKLLDASDERVLIGVAGPQAEVLVRALGAHPGAAMTSTAFDGGTVVRLDEQRFVLAVAAAAAEAVWNTLATGAKPAGLAAWRLTEIAAGQPRIVAATQEAFVPQMINYELPAVGGVSFQKGCYPGQEIVARTQYLGKVKRRMYRAKLDAAFPPGTDVFTPEAGAQHCGALVSIAPAPEGGYECLLVVQSSGMEAGEVHVGSPDGPKVAFLPLPYSIE
ncbi:MAG: folate-binding protein YgfZ [Sulfurisoma sp.]|nr:folate-binding protein YgfZ [Sulfurisoma sp.]